MAKKFATRNACVAKTSGTNISLRCDSQETLSQA